MVVERLDRDSVDVNDKLSSTDVALEPSPGAEDLSVGNVNGVDEEIIVLLEAEALLVDWVVEVELERVVVGDILVLVELLVVVAVVTGVVVVLLVVVTVVVGEVTVVVAVVDDLVVVGVDMVVGGVD